VAVGPGGPADGGRAFGPGRRAFGQGATSARPRRRWRRAAALQWVGLEQAPSRRAVRAVDRTTGRTFRLRVLIALPWMVVGRRDHDLRTLFGNLRRALIVARAGEASSSSGPGCFGTPNPFLWLAQTQHQPDPAVRYRPACAATRHPTGSPATPTWATQQKPTKRRDGGPVLTARAGHVSTRTSAAATAVTWRRRAAAAMGRRNLIHPTAPADLTRTAPHARSPAPAHRPHFSDGFQLQHREARAPRHEGQAPAPGSYAARAAETDSADVRDTDGWHPSLAGCPRRSGTEAFHLHPPGNQGDASTTLRIHHHNRGI
jgi:hypothetical protein